MRDMAKYSGYQGECKKEPRRDPLCTKTKTASPKKPSFFMFSRAKIHFLKKISLLSQATF